MLADDREGPLRLSDKAVRAFGVGLALASLSVVPAGASADAEDRSATTCGELKATAVLDPGERLRGSNRDDVILGSHGAERIAARKGDDLLCGRSGDDSLRDGRGSDRVFAGRGTDRVHGGEGGDRIGGAGGADKVNVADTSRDTVTAGPGADLIRSGDGFEDSVDCGSGDDTASIDTKDVLAGCETVKLGGGMPAFALPSWSDAGWSGPDRYLSIRTGDLDGDGAADLFGSTGDGIEAHRFDRELGHWVPLTGANAPSDSGGPGSCDCFWSLAQAADLDGDGRDELFTLYGGGIAAWSYDGDSWEALPLLEGPRAPSLAEGWGQPKYFSTIQAADLDGDGAEEIFGRSSGGLALWKFRPDQQAWDTSLPWFDGPTAPSDPEGWGVPQYYSTIQSADLNGDKVDEVYARGSGGIVAWSFAGGSWTTLPSLGEFTDGGGWDEPQYYSTIHSADLDGDGADEIYGRGGDGIHPFQLGTTPSVWTEMPGEGDLTDAAGWDAPRYYATIQSADVDGRGGDELLARGLTGMLTYGFDPTRSAWTDFSQPFPPYVSGDLATAYQAINEWINPDEPGFDIRAQYSQEPCGQLSEWHGDVLDMPQPPSVSDQAWSTVHTEIAGIPSSPDPAIRRGELGRAYDVCDWYMSYLLPVAQEIYVAESMDETAEVLDYNTQSGQGLEFNGWEIVEGILEGLDVLEPIPEIGEPVFILDSLLGGAVSAASGVSEVNDSLDPVKEDYLSIKGALEASFTAGINGLNQAQDEIQGDYDMQLAVGVLITTGTWSELSGNASQLSGDQGLAIAGAERAYSIGIWQTITPGIWSAIAMGPAAAVDVCENRPGFCDYDSGNFDWWLCGEGDCKDSFGALDYDEGQEVPQALRQQLFGQTSAACQQAWDFNSCALGVPYADVFFGAEGWQTLQAYYCEYDANSFLQCQRVR